MITDEMGIIGPYAIAISNLYAGLPDFHEYLTVDEIQPQKISKAKRALLKPSVTPEYKADRNALCPCGSGKKFKKCHLT